MSELRIVNLINGLVLVGEVKFNEYEDITIAYPLEVTAKAISDPETGKVVGEHMILKPHLVMTDDKEVDISGLNIISTHKLAERLYNSYNDMVDYVYKNEDFYDNQGSLVDKATPNESSSEPPKLEDLTDEQRKTLKDSVDSLLDSIGKPKKDDSIH